MLALGGLRAERARRSAAGAYDARARAALGARSREVLTAWLARYVAVLARRGGGGGAPDDNAGGKLCDGAALLASVLQRTAPALLGDASGADAEHDEDQVKGTLVLLTLAVAMYVSAFGEYEEGHRYGHRHQHGGERTRGRRRRGPTASFRTSARRSP